MKQLFALCLPTFLVCCFYQTKPDPSDDYFEKACTGGVMLEAELNKTQFDTSETIMIRGIARNCSKTDSVLFTVVPTGANFNIKFSLRNLRGFGTYEFQDFDLKFSNYDIVKPDLTTTQGKLAPGERLEVFSFDLKKLNNLRIGGNESEQHLFLFPGIYEFNWAISLSGVLSKPVFFEIK